MTLKFLRLLKTPAIQKHERKGDVLISAAASALQDKRYEEAIRLYGELIVQNGDNAEAFYKRANALNGLGRWEDALADYDGAIALDPAHARAYCNRGAVLGHLARWVEALASYEHAIALNPSDFLAFYNRGCALKELERFHEALVSYERAIALNGSYAPAYVNYGNVLHKLRRHEAALASYDQAIQLDSSIAEAFLGRGVSLFSLRRFEESLVSYDDAIRTKKDYVEAYCNRGTVFQETGEHYSAVANYAKAIELNPKFAAALHGQGFSLQRLQKFESAIESYNKAMAIEPERKYLRGMRLYACMQICDWSGLKVELQELAAGLEARKPISVPLPVLALLDAPVLHRLAAEIWAENEAPMDASLGAISGQLEDGKIRIGYFSSDFCEHAVSFVAAEVFERHDRDRFEITAFAFGPRPNDHMRARLHRAFDRFIDVRDKSDIDVARLARRLGIDIAVDLGGYTEYSRTNIFSFRAAPIQINYLGYPGTMGVEYMDYIIADRTVVPRESQRYYAEKVIYLPNSYMPSDSTRPTPSREFKRHQLSLPSEGFIFCCFNNSYKIAPGSYASWARILSRVDGSVLWLALSDPATARNLRREASSHGIDGNRLIFANRVSSRTDHLARLRVADLFLDTLPYNAHATAIDALWSGLPIITCCGESFPARVAASLLQAAGLPELITTTADQYEDLAVQLGTNPQMLAEIKEKLRRNLQHSPLFDTKSFAADLEVAYISIMERHRAGLSPDHIYVGA